MCVASLLREPAKVVRAKPAMPVLHIVQDAKILHAVVLLVPVDMIYDLAGTCIHAMQSRYYAMLMCETHTMNQYHIALLINAPRHTGDTAVLL